MGGSERSASTRGTLSRRGRWVLTSLLTVVLVWQWGNAATIEVKAQLAQILIERAWKRKLDDPDGRAAPWPWADTEPVGRLQWLDSKGGVRKDLYILAGAHGSALAFGPGLVDGVAPGRGSARVLGGHRDTHFAFLQRLSQGDSLRWQDSSGHWTRYRVAERRVDDSDEEMLRVDPGADALWLVTCYPFDTIEAGGPLRYVVRAEREESIAGESMAEENMAVAQELPYSALW